MKYIIQGTNIENLESREIEAESKEDAETTYCELWEAGMIAVVDSSVKLDNLEE